MNPAPDMLPTTPSAVAPRRPYVLVRISVQEQSDQRFAVTVTLRGGARPVQGTGVGPSDCTAVFDAIEQALGRRGRVLGMAVRLRQSGDRLVHEVRLGVDRGGRSEMGLGEAPDLVEACARAYLAAVSTGRDRAEPD